METGIEKSRCRSPSLARDDHNFELLLSKKYCKEFKLVDNPRLSFSLATKSHASLSLGILGKSTETKPKFGEAQNQSRKLRRSCSKVRIMFSELRQQVSKSLKQIYTCLQSHKLSSAEIFEYNQAVLKGFLEAYLNRLGQECKQQSEFMRYIWNQSMSLMENIIAFYVESEQNTEKAALSEIKEVHELYSKVMEDQIQSQQSKKRQIHALSRIANYLIRTLRVKRKMIKYCSKVESDLLSKVNQYKDLSVSRELRCIELMIDNHLVKDIEIQKLQQRKKQLLRSQNQVLKVGLRPKERTKHAWQRVKASSNRLNYKQILEFVSRNDDLEYEEIDSKFQQVLAMIQLEEEEEDLLYASSAKSEPYCEDIKLKTNGVSCGTNTDPSVLVSQGTSTNPQEQFQDTQTNTIGTNTAHISCSNQEAQTQKIQVLQLQNTIEFCYLNKSVNPKKHVNPVRRRKSLKNNNHLDLRYSGNMKKSSFHRLQEQELAQSSVEEIEQQLQQNIVPDVRPRKTSKVSDSQGLNFKLSKKKMSHKQMRERFSHQKKVRLSKFAEREVQAPLADSQEDFQGEKESNKIEETMTNLNSIEDRESESETDIQNHQPDQVKSKGSHSVSQPYHSLELEEDQQTIENEVAEINELNREQLSEMLSSVFDYEFYKNEQRDQCSSADLKQQGHDPRPLSMHSSKQKIAQKSRKMQRIQKLILKKKIVAIKPATSKIRTDTVSFDLDSILKKVFEKAAEGKHKNNNLMAQKKHKDIVQIIGLVYSKALEDLHTKKPLNSLVMPLYQTLKIIYGNTSSTEIIKKMINLMAELFCYPESKQCTTFLFLLSIDKQSPASSKITTFDVYLFLKLVVELSKTESPLKQLDKAYTTLQVVEEKLQSVLKSENISEKLNSKILKTLRSDSQSGKQKKLDLVFICRRVVEGILNENENMKASFQGLLLFVKETDFQFLTIENIKYILECLCRTKAAELKEIKKLYRQKPQEGGMFTEDEFCSYAMRLDLMSFEDLYVKILEKFAIKTFQNFSTFHSLKGIALREPNQELRKMRQQGQQNQIPHQTLQRIEDIIILHQIEKQTEHTLEKIIGNSLNKIFVISILFS